MTEISFGFIYPFGRASNLCHEIISFGSPLYNKTIAHLEKIKKNIKDIRILTGNCYPKTGCNLMDGETFEASLRIDSQGNVFPCSLCTTNEFSIGNIYENNLSEIVTGDKFKKLNELLRKRWNLKQCSNCFWNKICCKGCPAYAVARYGEILQTSGDCDFLKAYFRDAALHMKGIVK